MLLTYGKHDNLVLTAKNITGYCIIFAIFVAALVTNVVVASKIVEIGPFLLPASVFIWAATFPCTDVAAEVYGHKYAQKMVFGGFIAFALAIATVQLAVALPPASVWPNQEAYALILGTSGRVALAALTSYALTQTLDVYVFSVLREKCNGKYLWVRNNGSTLVSQTLANIVFLSIAFWGTMPTDKWLTLFVSNLGFRYILALSDTLLVYAGVYILYKAYPDLKVLR